MKVKVVVTPKAAVLDPQGAAVRDAMQHLGMPEVRDVRIGKYLEIELNAKDGDIEQRLRGLCRDLLSNPVIEDYELLKNESENQKESGKQEKGKKRQRKR
jgi:phosphoribosylformylglycinamidine synthase subunit PurS